MIKGKFFDKKNENKFDSSILFDFPINILFQFVFQSGRRITFEI